MLLCHGDYDAGPDMGAGALDDADDSWVQHGFTVCLCEVEKDEKEAAVSGMSKRIKELEVPRGRCICPSDHAIWPCWLYEISTVLRHHARIAWV